MINAPQDGFISITFSGSQLLDLAQTCCPPTMVARRYIALYGIGMDTTQQATYSITSSMQDSTSYYLGDGSHVPAKAITGNTVRPVTAGLHTVYFLTEITVEIDSDVSNKIESPSLTVTYFPYDEASYPGPGAARTGGAAAESIGEAR